ncbi:MAG: hypothetical protein HKO59_05870 [Phycisphaerales bacterium]|nr:hypothetical protein [Phycisphaerales bacterium]NNM25500.1 hypothetical protein [Phycisphaerales bacterium]
MSLAARWTTAILVFCLTTPAPAVEPGFPLPELAEVLPTDAGAGDFFARSVAVQGDVLVVGSAEHSAGGVWAGAAYVYRYTGVGAAWELEQKLIASDSEDFVLFGTSVAIDRNVIAIGAPRADEHLPTGGVIVDTGAVYIFRHDGVSWVEEQRLVQADQFIFDEFGVAVDLEGDRLLIGAHQDGVACEDDPDPVIQQNCNSGSAYIFERRDGTWIETAKLVASDTHVRDLFGAAVDLQGDLAAIGAWNSGNTAGPCPPDCDFDGHGAVYLYRLVDGAWIEEAILTPPDTGFDFEYFGHSISLSGDTILIGAEGDDAVAVSGGAAYIFRHDPGGPEPWVQVQKLKASDGAFADFFGQAVALRGDVALVGAIFDDIGRQSNVGSAYLYELVGEVWKERGKLVATDAFTGDFLGNAIAISDHWAMVGAFTDDDIAENAGALYIFGGLDDCDGSGTLDICDIAVGDAKDVDGDGVPDSCGDACPADLDGSGDVGFTDLLAILADWGPCPADCPADLDASGDVGFTDLLAVLAAWGPC